MNLKMRYYGSVLSLADVDPNNSYGWMLHLRKGSFASFLVSLFGTPHLGARVRHKILTEILEKPEGEESVFDVGCGFGLESLYLSGKGYKVFGIDKSDAKIKIAKKIAKELSDEETKFAAGDIFKFGKKTKFDNAILFEVLEHVKNPKDLLFKISEFVEPNGRLVVSCPAMHTINAKAKKFLGHEVVGYTPEEIKKMIKGRGLEIQKVYSFGNRFLAKVFFYIDYLLLRFVPLLSAGFFFLSYPVAVFDQKHFKGDDPMGYVFLIRKK